MRHMEITDSSVQLRKRKYSVMLEYTRTHRDYDSVCGGDGTASDVAVKSKAIDLSYWGLIYRCNSLEKWANVYGIKHTLGKL